MDGPYCSQRSPHSRLVAHSGPVRLICFPPSAPLIFGDRFCWQMLHVSTLICVAMFLVSCGFSEVTSNLVDGDAIS
jgi:hypothetical protein